jgi:hypothetical protein
METVDGSEVYRLAGRPDRSETSPPVPVTTTVGPHMTSGSRTGSGGQ